jgi:phosphate transport system substrate-binding protein
MKKWFVHAILLFIPFFLLSPGYSADKKIIRVNGAGMSADQVMVWANEFMEKNPDCNIVVTGSSAGKGFQNLFDRTAEIALASRDISANEKKTAQEKGIKLEDKHIGSSAVAVVTTARNPVNELTIEQLRKIYLDEFTNWKEVGGPDSPIRTITRRIPESGGAVFFWEHVLNKQAFGPNATYAETWQAILKVCTIAQDLPIGIVPASIAKGSVKVMAVKPDDNSPAVAPTNQNIANKSYPLILKFSMYWDAQSKDDKVSKFIDFCAERAQSGH